MINNCKQKYWPEQKQKSWFVVVVDGRSIGLIEEGKFLDKERKRLSGLIGIYIRKALPADLIKFNAKTILPSKILTVMSRVYENKYLQNNSARFHGQQAPGR
jgi:hypothetical protein